MVSLPISKVMQEEMEAGGAEGSSEGRPPDHRSPSEILIFDILKSSAEPLTFEEIIEQVPELSWNQVFLTVQALCRSGQIVLRQRGYTHEVHKTMGTPRYRPEKEVARAIG